MSKKWHPYVYDFLATPAHLWLCVCAWLCGGVFEHGPTDENGDFIERGDER